MKFKNEVIVFTFCVFCFMLSCSHENKNSSIPSSITFTPPSKPPTLAEIKSKQVDFSTYTENQYSFLNVELPVYKCSTMKIRNVLNEIEGERLEYPNFIGDQELFENITFSYTKYLEEYPQNLEKLKPIPQPRKRMIIQDYSYFKQQYKEALKELDVFLETESISTSSDTIQLLESLKMNSENLLELKFKYSIPTEYYH